MNAFSVILCIIGTLVIAGVSRRSLLHPRSHGFCRFFAWEGILLLVLLNAPLWLDDPLSTHQVFSWMLLTVSLYPVAHGVFLLHFVGKPAVSPASATDFAFEQTTQLVTVGIYKYIRHPLYASLLYLTWGVYLKDMTLLTAGISFAVSLFMYAAAKAEEKENVIHFGERYTRYAATTKMFIPYVW